MRRGTKYREHNTSNTGKERKMIHNRHYSQINTTKKLKGGKRERETIGQTGQPLGWRNKRK